jgi:glutamate-ammonia-ligase adenylyltransferase
MHHFFSLAGDDGLPLPANPEGAARGMERWRGAVENTGDSHLSAMAEAIAEDASGRRLVDAVFGNSPYLSQICAADPGFACSLLHDGPDGAFERTLADLDGKQGEEMGRDRLAALLRSAKRRVALTVALADIAGAWDLKKVTNALSGFAETALRLASGHVLRAAAEAGAFPLADPGNPEKDSGLVILGLGKLGGRELNYSSDIDLIVLYDPERIGGGGDDSLQGHMVRLTRDLVLLMEERTPEGYVFRCDLRLRPDPGSTPLAIPVQAALAYYEGIGQNWERAALIKARPVAGDIEAGEVFLERLSPFIWRKNLDFAAIRDIHSIKHQINAAKGGGKIAVAGHNIKLGRGGIREIEFFVQTQQLIWGGREASLRDISTTQSLASLARSGRISEHTATDMSHAYRFLRRVEHRLQMINDEQTHTLPADGERLEALAVFLGYAGEGAFAQDLSAHLKRVENHYAELFEHAPALSIPGTGNLVFTGVDADPDTLRTLKRIGFDNPDTVDAVVRDWHHGRYRATHSTRARELLTELMPALLKALARTARPDDAFLVFDEFLSRLPVGVQLFSMLYSKPHLLDLLAEIMGAAPRLARHLSRRPGVFESVFSPGFFDPPPGTDDLASELSGLLGGARDTEDGLDISRRWANDRRFQVGVQSLIGRLAPVPAAQALSAIAQAAIQSLLTSEEAAFSAVHGRVPDEDLAVLALGKLGSREMTPTSDLDLIFVYSSGDGTSIGPKPLSAGQYFTRLSQRLISALTVQTSEGALYEVDMRLRPSGNSGPLATSLDAFAAYQRDSAWTWEHQALTRARTVAGPKDFRRKADDAVRDILTLPRDEAKLLADVAGMRVRMDREHHTQSPWRVKHHRGGLVDIEFIAQYLQLKHAHEDARVLSTDTRGALRNLARAGFLDDALAGDLTLALDLWQAIQGMVQLSIEDSGGPIPETLRTTLAKLGGASDFEDLERKMRATADRVFGHFRDLIEIPASPKS